MISPGHFLQQLPVAQKINLKLPDQTNRASHRRTCLPLQPHCLGEFGRRNVCGTLFLTNGHPHTIPAHAQSTAFFPLPKPHPFAWPSNSQFSCRFSQGTSLESSCVFTTPYTSLHRAYPSLWSLLTHCLLLHHESLSSLRARFILVTFFPF